MKYKWNPTEITNQTKVRGSLLAHPTHPPAAFLQLCWVQVQLRCCQAIQLHLLEGLISLPEKQSSPKVWTSPHLHSAPPLSMGSTTPVVVG